MKTLGIYGLMVLMLSFSMQVTAQETSVKRSKKHTETTAYIFPPQSAKELIPTEDSLIPNMHCMGLINCTANIFRSANPVRDLLVNKKGSSNLSYEQIQQQSMLRMKRLYDVGIRTIFCFQHTNGSEKEEIELEKLTAQAVGINFINYPLSNSGKNSFEDMTTSEVLNKMLPICKEIIKDAEKGGVLFHCKAGHDRTGLTAALLRVKWQGWKAEQAINEMRALGHNPSKFSKDTNEPNSWIEAHIIEAEKQLRAGS